MLDRILVPLDTSELAEAILPHARALATAFRSRIHLLTVVESPDTAALDSVEWRFRRDEQEAYLRRVAEDLAGDGLEVHCHVESGAPADLILDHARDLGVDLLALTSHGRGGFDDYPLSGTVSKVVAGAETSVLVVHPCGTENRNETRAPVYSKILAPVDCSSRGDWAVHLAARVARDQGAELLLVSVVESPHLLGSPAAGSERARLARQLGELERGVAQDHLDHLVQRIDRENHLQVETRVVEDTDPAAALQRVAEEDDISLVVLCAHGTSPGSSWAFGTVSHRLLEHCHQPLLVFQDAPPDAATDLRGERNAALAATLSSGLAVQS